MLSLKKNALACFVAFALASSLPGDSFALSDAEVSNLQNSIRNERTGDRIAFFAEQFLGTPYDTDPLGTYVTDKVIVSDKRVDCMYLVFRAVELALSSSPDEAVKIALEKRFHTAGILSNGRVVNYSDRFDYGEDMIYSGKWGREATAEIGETVGIKDSRSGKDVIMLTPNEALKGMKRLRNGDLIFFIKAPQKAVSHELVGHIGIVRTTKGPGENIYMIHASGRKWKGGIVRKTELGGYLKKMPFIGIKVTRFQ